ncbi:MAG: aminotransferase class III-fold pyridoxal phosphate-dependent enzyme, partial [Rhodospirillales bacterium]|nr:aminotransferase class III-fold pyridoxal phosphate-dependent enzyme [Rhodospirillales bacterium]
PAVCAVAEKVVETLAAQAFLANVQGRAIRLADALAEVVAQTPLFVGQRGKGLMQALVVAAGHNPSDVVAACRERGLLVTRAGSDAVRLLPPLTVSEPEIEQAASILAEAALALVAPRSSVSPSTQARSKKQSPKALEKQS